MAGRHGKRKSSSLSNSDADFALPGPHTPKRQETRDQPSIAKQVRSELANLSFAPGVRAEVILSFGQEVLKGLRPGAGLLGTKEEEAALYGKHEEAQAVRMKEQAGNGGDVTMGDTESDVKADVEPGPDPETVSDEGMEGVDFDVYKPLSKKKRDADEEEALGDYERESFGFDFVEMPDGNILPIWEYLGPAWDEKIKSLYDIPPLDVPAHMRMIPRDFQLKAAAQGLHCLAQPERLFLLGDEMGVGKTLSAILMMHAKKDLPGMSIVICPKNVCHLWVETIHDAWEGGYGMRAFHIDDSSITQSQLLAEGYDVIVCSYEFFEANGRAMHAYPERIRAAANDQTVSRADKLVRPTSALHSAMLGKVGLNWKIAVLDEAQRVNKREKLRHESIKDHLNAESFVMLSGTLPHNRWYDFSGYIDFGVGHPFTTHNKFLHTFSSLDLTGQIDHPSTPKMRLLQKFLQAFVIARPASILQLQNCLQKQVVFRLNEEEQSRVTSLTEDYKAKAAFQAATIGIDTLDSSSNAFGLAVIAQMAALHPMLGDAVLQKRVELQDFSDGGVMEGLQNVVVDEVGEQRDKWLQEVMERVNLVHESGRLTTLMRLYDWLQETYPGEKLIIFSSSLRFLDIVAEAFRREKNVDPLRYDGLVPSAKRESVETAFKKCLPSVPLLMTIHAGGVGLNIQHASLVIIAEHQWNISIERQGIARAHRQGQEKMVKAFILHGENSSIDILVRKLKLRKARVNGELMEPLLRTPSEGRAEVKLLTFPGLRPLRDE